MTKLKLSDEKLSARLIENSARLERFSEVLGNLERTNASATRSASFVNRQPNHQFKKDRR